MPAVTTHTFMLQGEHEVSPHFKVDASVGVGLTNAGPLPVSSGTSLLGGLGLSGRARRTTWDLRYGRSTYQALGFGRNYLTDYASASLEHRLAKRLTGRLEARYRHSRESLIGAYAFDTQHYGTSARYRIQKRTLAAAYYYWRRLTRSIRVTFRARCGASPSSMAGPGSPDRKNARLSMGSPARHAETVSGAGTGRSLGHGRFSTSRPRLFSCDPSNPPPLPAHERTTRDAVASQVFTQCPARAPKPRSAVDPGRGMRS